MEFDKAKNTTLYDNVVSQICEMILSGHIKMGEYLPSEKKLCEQFGVSRTTVREALGILSHRKIVRTIRGKGSMVTSDNFTYLHEGPRARIRRYEHVFLHAVQARQLLEPQVAALAARVATRQDIEALQAVIDMCQERERNGTVTTDDLRSFHLCVAKITRNPVLISMVENLISMCDAPPETSLQVPNPGEQARTGILISHEMVLQAIRDHDSESAYFYMKENLKNFQENSLQEF